MGFRVHVHKTVHHCMMDVFVLMTTSNHRTYYETVHLNHLLTLADLKLNHHEGWHALKRIEGTVDLLTFCRQFFIINKPTKTFLLYGIEIVQIPKY